MKAYPNAQIKIGGYTDNTGDPTANQTLSENRAKNVMDAIVAGGIDPSRLQSKGYGDQYPVADNGTPEGRAQNRRIALLVTQK
jgi:outer membrane protein OmpA-like peptidoglycan-associated protein